MSKKFKRFVKQFFTLFKRKKLIPIMQTKTNDLMANKRAIIIGGDGGIGFAIAREFVACGCEVLIIGRNKEKLEKCNRLQPELKTMSFSLNDFEGYNTLFVKASEMLGGNIDVVVNSAGTHTSYPGFDFLNVSFDEYDRVLEVNLKSSYFLCQFAGNYFIKNKIRGHILLISSSTSLEPSWSPYRISKRGLQGLIEGAAQKLIPYGIVVNGIAPGPTNTNMVDYKDGDSIFTSETPLERYTTVEEIAQYAKMMCTSLGDTIVGQTIFMSGGRGTIDRR